MENKSYFTVKEICSSSVAKKNKINNVPDDVEILDNINYLIDNLNVLRAAWLSPIIISSGYRCPALNKLVGGSKTSSHMSGLASDILPKKMEDFPKFVLFIRNFYKYHDFDQCILELVGNSKWIHIGFSHQNRKQFLKTTNGKTYQNWMAEDLLV